MKTTILHSLEEIQAYAPRWQAIPNAGPFGYWEFIESCLRNAHPGIKPFVIIVQEGEQLLAIAPWWIERQRGIRKLTGIGGHDAWYHDPIVLPNCDIKRIAPLLAELLTASKKEWDVIHLNFRNGSSPLLQRISQLGCLISKDKEEDRHPVLKIEDGWDEFWKRCTKNHRQNAKRDASKLAKVSHRYIQADADNFDTLLGELFRLHALQWPGDPRWKYSYAVIRGLAEGALKHGDLFFYGLLIDERIVAANLAIRSGEQAFGILAGYAAEFSDLSLGKQLFLHLAQGIFASGVTTLNLGPGYYEWKKSYITDTAESREVMIASPSSIPGLAYITWQGKYKPLLRHSETAYTLYSKYLKPLKQWMFNNANAAKERVVAE